MKVWIKGGEVYREHQFQRTDLLIENGVIREIGEHVNGDGAKCLDVAGKRIVPGFFDIHTHGAVNVDVNTATAEDLETICRFFASQGTTSWLCSVLTDTKEQTLWCIEQYNRWKQMEHQGAILEGIHLEGPFLCSEYKGAMPEYLLRKPDIELLKEYQQAAGGDIRYLTISPEIEGAVETIPGIRELGIHVAIGHSGADYDTARAAIAAGAEAATHTGNVMKLLHQHFPAIWGAVLEDDDLYCEIICDGRHLHPGTVRLIIKTKGFDRVVAITDSIMAAGLPDGRYHLGVNEVVVEDGDAKLAENGVRAGSTLILKKAFENLLDYTGKTPEEILPVLTENPAKVVGLFDSIGSIEVGKRASLQIMDQENHLQTVLVNGNVVEL